MRTYVATYRPIGGQGPESQRKFKAASPLAAEVRAQHIARERVLFLVAVKATGKLQ